MKYTVEYYNAFEERKAVTITAPNPAAAIDRARHRADFDKYICVTIKKENDMPTTPTPAPDKITADELRRAFVMIENRFDEMATEILEIKKSLNTMYEGISHAATATPPVSGTFAEMMIDNIIMTYDDKGKKVYKATGTPYNKFGVRIWEEVLPNLISDPAALHPGPNPQQPPIRARVMLKETLDDSGSPRMSPQKVTGKM
jgi:hypothetical protein